MIKIMLKGYDAKGKSIYPQVIISPKSKNVHIMFEDELVFAISRKSARQMASSIVSLLENLEDTFPETDNTSADGSESN